MGEITLSFLAPPFPYFIEGNITRYNKGQSHPNRYNLGYFDVIMIKEGVLYLGEENEEWELVPGDVFILEPHKHHYPLEDCKDRTSFYWLHFQTKHYWCAQAAPSDIRSDTSVPTLHFYSDFYTIHLPKWQHLPNTEELFVKMDYLLHSTTKQRSISFWETQQSFLQILQMLEFRRNYHDSGVQLAEQVEIYLKKHYRNPITNQELSRHFHVHENYLARCMKKAFQCTPLKYLSMYRLHQARSLLLKTDSPVSQIADETGFSNLKYFSTCFKKEFGLSPSQYRKKYRHME
ncbi:helix-turn-helix transcriptional regulator [Paenactinomyces guangxiensis]|uniref:Helix-turn-helix transcriptional regulator n=1 Tax=Paenactinomyces guangxiensis TaxID=1490290 RepID=A0A7W2A6J6_9BACL|nr:helix-turn-helix domain-containing protein [Paenactinomyces guangxiensis]MBA4493441.1 helix-turn-helix transcriptional regulator [Paenactinomyces guangxiensis]MBH8590532.1 helix-turn-helix transcriptional regulator [Paenactinomyces guangxiensis]